MNISDKNDSFESSPDNDINSTVYFTFTVVFFTLGFFGNTLIFLAVFVEKKLRTRGYVFTVNSAISDCFVLILADIFIIAGIATDGQYLRQNQRLCEVSSGICLSVCICSIWSHTAGSFHSYIRVCHRLRYHKICNRTAVSGSIIFIWIGSQLVVLPTFLGWGKHSYNDFLRYCVPDYLISPSYTGFFLTFGIFLPLLITSYSFVKIGCDVFVARKRVLSRVHPSSSESSRQAAALPAPVNSSDARLVRCFLFIAIYLFSAWFFLVVIMICGDNKSFSSTEVTIAMSFAHTHCSMNGILYAATNKVFRGAYVKLFSRCCKL